MTALTIRLPTSVHRKVKELALRAEISINQAIASAVAEKMASVLTLELGQHFGQTLPGGACHAR